MKRFFILDGYETYNPVQELSHKSNTRFRRQTTVYEIETMMVADFSVYTL